MRDGCAGRALGVLPQRVECMCGDVQRELQGRGLLTLFIIILIFILRLSLGRTR